MNIKEYKKVKNYFNKNIIQNTPDAHKYFAELIDAMINTDVIGDIEFIETIDNQNNTITKYYTIYKNLSDMLENETSQVYDTLAVTWQK